MELKQSIWDKAKSTFWAATDSKRHCCFLRSLKQAKSELLIISEASGLFWHLSALVLNILFSDDPHKDVPSTYLLISPPLLS